MARKPRLHVTDGLYHVMLRGNGGQDIFFHEEDRYHLYLLLQEGVSRFGYRIHAFCLMGNHLHLAVQVGEVPLSKSMQNVAFRYTRWINQRQRRIGHLFQGRYKAILVDADSYLLQLVRYIHLNPVRAHLVREAVEYPWSGHRAYLGQEVIPWLTTDWVLSQLAEREAVARRCYAMFVAEGKGEGHCAEFYGSRDDIRVLGDDRFVEQVTGRVFATRTKPLRLRELARRYCDVCQFKEVDLVGPSRARGISEARAKLAWLAVKQGVANLVELGTYLHRDASTLSRMVQRVEIMRTTDASVKKRLAEIENTIMQA